MRDYREEPLTQEEIRRVVELLGAHPGELLRTRKPIGRQLGLTRESPAETLIDAMAAYSG